MPLISEVYDMRLQMGRNTDNGATKMVNLIPRYFLLTATYLLFCAVGFGGIGAGFQMPL